MAVRIPVLHHVSWAVALLLCVFSGSPIPGGGGTRNLHSLGPSGILDGRCPMEGATHSVRLASGEYFRAWLEPHEPLSASISDPAGHIVLTADLGPGTTAPLSFAAGRTGTYRLEVRGGSDMGVFPSHRLYLHVKRWASERDIQRVSTERDFLEAEELAQGWQEEPRRRAVEAFERVLASSREIGDPLLEARALIRLGDLYRSLGEARIALKHYQKALTLEQGVSVQVDAHLGAALANVRLDEREKTLEHTRKALALNEASGDERGRARALTTLGVAHHDSDRIGAALSYLQEALAIWQRLEDKRGESEALMQCGFAYSGLSQEESALKSHFKALDLARQVKDRRLEAVVLTAIGHTYSKMGEKQEALNFYYQANPILEAMGDPYWTVSLYSGMGYVYSELGDEESAIEYFARAVEINQRISSPRGEGENLVLLGRAHLSFGHIEKALACYRNARQLFQRLGERRMVAVALDGIADAYAALGREAEALDYYERALALYEASEFKREEADTLNNLGRIEARRGQVQTALRHFSRALALSRETQDRFGESRALLNLARLARASGDLDEARVRAEEALGLVEQLRGSVSSYWLRASYFSSIHDLHEFYVNLLVDLHLERPSERFDRLALQASEKARARSLLERLSDEEPDNGVDPKLLEHRDRLERKIRETAGALEQGTRRALEAEALPGSSAELSELLSELDRLRAVIRSQGAGHDPLDSVPVSVKGLQNDLLDSSTLLLSYFLGSERSFLWAVTETTLSLHILPPQEEIETHTQAIYRVLAARERRPGETSRQYHQRVRARDREFWEAASTLSQVLLGPVQGELETKRLVIVGDGNLHHFPFSALPVPAPPPGSAPLPLIASHEIIRLPSASTLAALKTRDLAHPKPVKTVAILADPVFDRNDPRVGWLPLETHGPGTGAAKDLPSWNAGALSRSLEDVGLSENGTVPRLLASQQEAEGILKMVSPEESLAALGFEASRALATSGALAQYQVVHFATHGILNTKHPELSGIILSLVDEDGEPQDGFLRLHDIENLDLPVDLVVLSACSTGLGKEVKGEGMIGLVRGFMSAGADRILASYWNVDDEATADLMKRFYRNLFAGSLTPSAALREAQLSMWREKRWRSPFYWAAFELQGQWQ